MVSLRTTLKIPETCGNDLPLKIDGAVFSHGTEFRGKYKGYYYQAKVENGALVLNGRRFLSPSAAAFSITREPALEGCFFWECKDSVHESWASMSSLQEKK